MARTNNGSSRKAPHYLLGARVAREGRNPFVHGEIKDSPVGTTWSNRFECSAAGVHAPPTAGIHGNAKDGAYSVVLSGGYEDDMDDGETIVYTGQGGRGTKSTLMDELEGKRAWGGPQISDQEWKFGNNALKISCETKKPIRVIRGFQPDSQYAPLKGYRYDGLYTVEKAWKAVGVTGFKTCRFRFKRLPGQPPIPKRPSTRGRNIATHLQTPQSESPELEAGPSDPLATTSPSPPKVSSERTRNLETKVLEEVAVPRSVMPHLMAVVPSSEASTSPSLLTPRAVVTNPRVKLPDSPFEREDLLWCDGYDDTDDEDEGYIPDYNNTRKRWASVEGVRKYAGLKFKKQKTAEDIVSEDTSSIGAWN
ncbi:PUA-like domain-containing protein [Collybia nuda]|uniref:PUA-like domain-containing protein n=1 Tax=Collybia nuda TaxID=64659 RepID=A0A9P5Y3Y5_9AGAR|nr:PUA-like domain-containing protein [Collybia nuda]